MKPWIASALLASVLGTAAAAPADTLPMALARKVALRTIGLVEKDAVYPRQQSEYDKKKAELLALVNGQDAELDRTYFYWQVNQLMWTLDADGHSFIMSPQVKQQQEGLAPAPAAPAAPVAPVPTFRTVSTPNGLVLQWTPPQVVATGEHAMADYLKRFYDEANAFVPLTETCAVLVDLTGQPGGNAWPPFIAMHPLFSAANSAFWVDRTGKRDRFVVPANLKGMENRLAPGQSNPLVRFSGQPIAVVTNKNTSSAGEMLMVALIGEGDRAQTFGHASGGFSTANRSIPMEDGSVLVLTMHRYAVADQAVYRGPIPVANPAAQDEDASATIMRAAQWVARQSPQCRAATPKS